MIKIDTAQIAFRNVTDGTLTVMVAVDPADLVCRVRKLIAVCFEDGAPPDGLCDNSILRHLGISPLEDGWNAKK